MDLYWRIGHLKVIRGRMPVGGECGLCALLIAAACCGAMLFRSLKYHVSLTSALLGVFEVFCEADYRRLAAFRMMDVEVPRF